MYKIIFTDKVHNDMDNIFDFIAQDNPFYAHQVYKNITKAATLLWEFPYIGVSIEWWFRQIVEPRYKFKIVYSIDEDTVYIVSVFREQQDWKKSL